MDLEKLRLTENFGSFENVLKIKNSKDRDLARDYKFFKIEDNGSIEKNAGRVIKDYYIAVSNSKVSYTDVLPDELMFRTINDTIIGYRFDIYDPAKTQKLLLCLKEKYGKGKLVFGNDKNESQVYIWRDDVAVISFSTIVYIGTNEDGSKNRYLGGVIEMVKLNELKNGTWPLYNKLLIGLEKPDLGE